jgi:hypothetical protein
MIEQFVNVAVSKSYIVATSTIRHMKFVINRVYLFDRYLKALDTWSCCLENDIVCKPLITYREFHPQGIHRGYQPQEVCCVFNYG